MLLKILKINKVDAVFFSVYFEGVYRDPNKDRRNLIIGDYSSKFGKIHSTIKDILNNYVNCFCEFEKDDIKKLGVIEGNVLMNLFDQHNKKYNAKFKSPDSYLIIDEIHQRLRKEI